MCNLGAAVLNMRAKTMAVAGAVAVQMVDRVFNTHGVTIPDLITPRVINRVIN